MQTNHSHNFADIDYGRILAEANAERSKMLNQMFRQARAYIAGLFTTHRGQVTSN